MTEQLKCKSCGAPLTPDGRCEYCGARYKVEKDYEHISYVEVVHPQVSTLRAETIIQRRDYQSLPPEYLSQRAIEDLKHKMVDGLSAFIKIDVEEDMRLDAKIIRGTIRVIPPDFRF